jgi:hypothetical protein
MKRSFTVAQDFIAQLSPSYGDKLLVTLTAVLDRFISINPLLRIIATYAQLSPDHDDTFRIVEWKDSKSIISTFAPLGSIELFAYVADHSVTPSQWLPLRATALPVEWVSSDYWVPALNLYIYIVPSGIVRSANVSGILSDTYMTQHAQQIWKFRSPS